MFHHRLPHRGGGTEARRSPLQAQEGQWELSGRRFCSEGGCGLRVCPQRHAGAGTVGVRSQLRESALKPRWGADGSFPGALPLKKAKPPEFTCTLIY